MIGVADLLNDAIEYFLPLTIEKKAERLWIEEKFSFFSQTNIKFVNLEKRTSSKSGTD